MNPAVQVQYVAKSLTPLGIYCPPANELNVARWRINGHRAAIVIWTSEEWERLADRPTDAQYYPCGVWCAVRLECPPL
jgi:hypothetical protein